ncbi:hypothetical protein [Photorhabdus akhurstii]|uniref:hypothetical protein n=1 Tax=Photorhabdus akhurstii TaxID=171438 RepID=UPI0011B06DD6
METVELAKSAAPKKSRDAFTCGSLDVDADHEYAGLRLIKKDGKYVQIATNPNGQDPLTIYYRDNAGNTIYYANLQKKSGTLATLNDVINTDGGVVGKNSYSTIDNFDNVRPNSTYFGYANETMNAPAETGAGIRFSHSATGGFI